jgi:indolepyruvate ferredoxin oxidoreductase beta subunit
MDVTEATEAAAPPALAPRDGLLTIAILAMGGEGGGVLADWIVELAESNGFIAQSTSVPGVAQRTGATIYYVELYPRQRADADRAEPVLALMPTPGDVDIVLASELMEAGRAVVRGFVTPGRTTLICSTHRVYSIAEKTAPGDGRVDSAALLREVAAHAQRLIAFDMDAIARRHGSVISAALFGALCASGALPFAREQFEATIARGAVGVAASRAAFAAAFERARAPGSTEDATTAGAASTHATAADAATWRLFVRIESEFDAPLHALLRAGVERLRDYQDPAYAALYLDRLQALRNRGSHRLLEAVARHLALWMSYEDTIRVADLKTRAGRFGRVAAEVGVQRGQLLQITDFLHPRVEEIADTLPAAVGRRLLASKRLRRIVERLVARPRRIEVTALSGFLLLYAVAGLRRWRRRTLRYAVENERIERWLQAIKRAAAKDPEVATELARCQQLLKGYSDTHARSWQKFQTVFAAAQRADFCIDASALRALREAALADEDGAALQQELQRQGLLEAVQ